MNHARSLVVLLDIWVGGRLPATADDLIKPTVKLTAAEKDASKKATVTAVVTDVQTEDDRKGETVTIPLESIWGHGVGGKSLRSLEPQLNRPRTPEETEALRKLSPDEIRKYVDKQVEASRVVQIELALQKLPLVKEGKNAKRGFAVAGIGEKALPALYDVLVKGQKPETAFPAIIEVSVVFFSHPSRARVAIDRIERQGNVIRVHYMLISDGVLLISPSLSLIPLGRLQPGRYHVEMLRSAAKEPQRNRRGFPAVEAGAEDRIICRPFEFTTDEQYGGDLSNSAPTK